MNHEDEDYTVLLRALRDTPDPGTEGISVDRAVKDGRRTVRRRRVVGGVAVVALIAAASTSPLLLNAIRDRDNGQPVGPVPGTAQPFSLWSQAFEAGSAGGFTPSSYLTGRNSQQIRMRPDSAAAGKSTAGVTMLAPGIDPSTLDGWSTKTQLEDIDGRPAYEVKQTGQAQPSVTVAWKYDDNGWGFAWVAGPAAQLDRARHVAESVHRGIGKPVSVPFTVSRAALGPELEVTSVSTPFGSNPSGVSEYLLGLSPGADDLVLPAAEPKARLTVGITTALSTFDPRTTISGRAAEIHATYTRIILSDDYLAIAEQSPLSSYSFNYTAVAGSVKQSAPTTDPIR